MYVTLSAFIPRKRTMVLMVLLSLKRQAFLQTCESETGAIAVHCKAGLGRTGTNIAAYMMKHYGYSAREATAWCRVCRPGCVVGPQQQYLETIQERMWLEGRRYRAERGGGAEHALGSGVDSQRKEHVEISSSVKTKSSESSDRSNGRRRSDGSVSSRRKRTPEVSVVVDSALTSRLLMETVHQRLHSGKGSRGGEDGVPTGSDLPAGVSHHPSGHSEQFRPSTSGGLDARTRNGTSRSVETNGRQVAGDTTAVRRSSKGAAHASASDDAPRPKTSSPLMDRIERSLNRHTSSRHKDTTSSSMALPAAQRRSTKSTDGDTTLKTTKSSGSPLWSSLSSYRKNHTGGGASSRGKTSSSSRY